MINAGWEIKELNDICRNITTNNKRIKQKNYQNNAELPVIDQGEDLIGGYTNDVSSKIECKLPAIIFGDHTKAVKFVNFEFAPGADGIKVLEPKKNINPKFFYYLLKRMVFEIPDKGYARHFQYLGKENYPVPPLPTQNRIVEKIEELFSDLDHGVENLKKAQQQLKTYRQAVLKDAFEGKLTKEWREQQDDLPTPKELLQQIKAERKAHRQRELAEWEEEVEQWEKDGEPGRKPRKPRKQSSQSPLTEEELNSLTTLPNGWKWVQFDNVAEVKTNLVDPEHYKSFSHIAPNYIKKYTGQLLEYNSIEHDGVTSPKHLFYSGQIVYSKIRPYLSKLILAPFDGLCSADMYPIETNLKTKYLYYLMLSDVFLNQASTAGSRSVLPKINQKELGIIKLPICSLREQEEIVNKIESSISIIDQLEQTIKENLQKAEALRQSILKKAFRGELVKI